MDGQNFFIAPCERRISCRKIHKTDVARIKGRRFVLAYFRHGSTKKSARGEVGPEWIGVNDGRLYSGDS